MDYIYTWNLHCYINAWWLTWALGGVCIKAGDCAGPGQASQAGVYRLGKERAGVNVTKSRNVQFSWEVSGCRNSSPCSWCWSHCFGNCYCCGASWPCETFFTTTPHSSPWRQRSRAPRTGPLNAMQSALREGAKSSEVGRSLISLSLYINSGEESAAFFCSSRNTQLTLTYFYFVGAVQEFY